MTLPAASTMLPLPSTRPMTAPEPLTTVPSARTEKPPAEIPPPVAPEIALPAEPAAPEMPLPIEPAPRPLPETLTTERAMTVSYTHLTLPTIYSV